MMVVSDNAFDEFFGFMLGLAVLELPPADLALAMSDLDEASNDKEYAARLMAWAVVSRRLSRSLERVLREEVEKQLDLLPEHLQKRLRGVE